MSFFQKKPEIAEAMQIHSYLDLPKVCAWVEARGGKATYGQEDDGPAHLLLSTAGGLLRGNIGDWVLRYERGGWEIRSAAGFDEAFEPVAG